MDSKKSRILVAGLGNPSLGDDGVGWRVAEEVKRRLTSEYLVAVDCLSVGGVSLMEHFIGYCCVILVDAFTLEEPIGSILILKLDDLPRYSAFHPASARDTSLQAAIEMGKSIGAELPDDVTVVGIVTKRVSEFSRKLSPRVEQAVPQAAGFIFDLLNEKMRLFSGAG